MYDEYTISLWLKADPLSNADYTRVVDYGDRRGELIIYTENSFYYLTRNTSNSTFYTKTFDYSYDGSWHHIACVLESGMMRLYVDGTQTGDAVSMFGELSSADAILYIGCENGKYRYTGLVDDVRLYGRGLNAGEIATLSSSGDNLAPFVDAGSDQVHNDALVPVTVDLTGDAGDDRLAKGSLSPTWSVVGDGSGVSIASPSDYVTTATIDAGGVYQFEFSVSDGEQTGYDTVEIVVNAADLALDSLLVGYWEFDEGSGMTANDASGNTLDGTIVGDATYSTDVPSALSGSAYSLSFDGDDHVAIDGIGMYDEYTISLWLKADPLSNADYTRVVDYGDRRGELIIYTENSFYYLTRNTSNSTFYTNTFDYSYDGSWHHIACVLESGMMRLYVDGTQTGDAVSMSGELSSADAILYIGCENGIRNYSGLFDDVRMYGRALNAGEIAALFEGQTGGETAALTSSETTVEPIVLIDDFSDLSQWTDLSSLIEWGGSAAGTSAFVTGDTADTQAVYLSETALAHAGFSSESDLKAFSCLDYGFDRAVDHRAEGVTVEFDARWESVDSSDADSGYFSVILLDYYPEDGVYGEDYNYLDNDPYGTPAYHCLLRPGGESFLRYGGRNGGEFDTYEYRWWLPGELSNTDGSESRRVGEGEEYPYGSWQSAGDSVCDTQWVHYRYEIGWDSQRLYRNDTLVASMPLPEYSSTAPDYTYYEWFEGLRLYWRGRRQCFLANFAVEIKSDDEVSSEEK
jgi:hypothetical protein